MIASCAVGRSHAAWQCRTWLRSFFLNPHNLVIYLQKHNYKNVMSYLSLLAPSSTKH